jgi:signal transduction histidine kinase
LEDHGSALEPEGHAALATIRTAVQQMNQLIDDLLAYARLERRAAAAAPLDLRELIHGLIAERADDLRAYHIRVTVDIRCGPVSADAEGLAQALRNLLDNAVKFSAGLPEPAIAITAQPSSSGCRVVVRDNGIGFDMRFHDRIFGIFQRLHRAEDYPGTGIGLAIVEKAIRRMHGRVWAESEPGHGASFYFEIPCEAEDAAR